MANAKLLGNVDLLGLNAMGNPVGLNSMWGILIGGGVSNFTSMALSRTSGKSAAHADLLGFLAGAAVGGTLMGLGKNTRGAGAATIATAFITSGMRWLENVLFGQSQATTAKAVAGMGLPSIQALNGLGLPSIQALNGGMGMASIAPRNPPHGTIPGVAGLQVSGVGMGDPPVSLLGQQSHGGGPTISGLSARYGATLLGGR
jgi:hypothetical protein